MRIHTLQNQNHCFKLHNHNCGSIIRISRFKQQHRNCIDHISLQCKDSQPQPQFKPMIEKKILNKNE